MKISVRGGHNPQAIGAIGIVKEVTEDRNIYASVIKWLKLDKNEVLDVTPGDCITQIDLAYGVNKANDFKSDLFCSIHLNAGGGHGSESLYFGTSEISKAVSIRVCNSLSKLGFHNRGAKSDVRGLFELKNTKMAAVIIECFFVDSAIDVALYKKVGPDIVGKAIAEGIVGHAINIPVTTTTKIDLKVLELQKLLNKFGATDQNNVKLDEDGLIGHKTKVALNKLILKL